MKIGARKVVRDTGLSLGLNLTVRAAGALTFIALGRLASTTEAGTFSLAVGFLAILTTLFTGIDDILVREVARQPEQTWSILVTYGLLRGALCLGAWLLLMLVLAALSLYSVPDMWVIGVITGSILLDTFSALAQSVFNAHHRFGWPFIAILVGATLEVGVAVAALLRHAGLLAIAWASPIGSLVTALILVAAVTVYLRGWPRPRVLFQGEKARALLRLVPAFAGSGFLSALEYQLDVILLSVLATHADVAEYSAAVTIMLVVLTLSQAYRVVLYPLLVRSLAVQVAQARQLIGRSLAIMGGAAVLAASVISLAAPAVIHLVFGTRFDVAGPVLRVLIWNVVWFFLNVPLVRFMMAANGQGTVFRTLLVSLSVNVLANIVLIPSLGPLGSAYARLLSSGLFCVLMAWAVGRRLRQPVHLPAM
jgi:O-antigen/teichoic acid export membrane protein